MCVLVFVSAHSSLEGTQTRRFDIGCLVGEPQSRGHVHDEAERVPVFDLRHPHALDVPLGALLQLLLHRREKMKTSKAVRVEREHGGSIIKMCIFRCTACRFVRNQPPTKCHLHLLFTALSSQ